MRETFQQKCVFADHRRVGEIDSFKMKSGRYVVARLVEIDTANYQWTADDTGQRDLTWEVIDTVMETQQLPWNLNFLVRMESGKEIQMNHYELLCGTVGTFNKRSIQPTDILRREYATLIEKPTT